MSPSETTSGAQQPTPGTSSPSHVRLRYVATFGFFFTMLFNLEEYLLGGEYGSKTTFEELDAYQVDELVVTLENARYGVELLGNSVVEAAEMVGFLDRTVAELRKGQNVGPNELKALLDALRVARNAVHNALSGQPAILDRAHWEDNGSNWAPAADIEMRLRALMAFADTFLRHLTSMLEDLAEPGVGLDSMWMSTVFACTDSAIGMTHSLHQGGLDSVAAVSKTLERMREHLMTMAVEEGGAESELVLNAAYSSAALSLLL